jgi:L-threonylcarbamoyladenylate synthase
VPPPIITESLAADAAGIARAAALLRAGAAVAFPTETVYGLGARADDAAAVDRIFRAKGRPAQNPLIVHVLDARAAAALCSSWPEAAARLAAAFWPGPLTLVVSRRAGALADAVTAGGDTVALRAPAHPVARELLRVVELPIAAPSANPSTSISPTAAAHVLKALSGRIAAVIEGGSSTHGIESTIVAVGLGPPRVLRLGSIALADLRAVIEVDDPGPLVTPAGQTAPAPGTAAKHYAPRAALHLVPRAEVEDRARRLRDEGGKVGTLTRDAQATTPFTRLDGPAPRAILADDPTAYASSLYAALHWLDDRGCAAIVAEAIPGDAAWAAVADRLRRAAS